MSAGNDTPHLPGRAPIDAYGGGGFRFADMSHRGSILCLPSGVYAWDVARLEDLTVASVERVIGEAREITHLLIGTGATLSPLPQLVQARLREAGITAEPMATGQAARTYNILISENRKVAAALIAMV
jgi:uncharacterized protein